MTVTTADVEGWRSSLSNWGRWGPGDRAGTLNLVTAKKRVAAARLVRSGEAVSCGRPVDAMGESDDAVRPTHVMTRTLNPDAASDFFALAPHGYGVTHVDALGHFSFRGRTYNDVERQATAIRPSTDPAIDVMAQGLITRGVLLDIPRLRRAPFLEPGEAIGVDELRRAAEQQGSALEAGDVLLVRTGRWLRRATVGTWNLDATVAGLDPETLPFLRAADLAALGCDAISDVLPSRVEGVRLPIHELSLVTMGMHLLDNLDLEPLADACVRHDRWKFLLAIAPLAIRFGTASPVNPIAVF